MECWGDGVGGDGGFAIPGRPNFGFLGLRSQVVNRSQGSGLPMLKSLVQEAKTASLV